MVPLTCTGRTDHVVQSGSKVHRLGGRGWERWWVSCGPPMLIARFCSPEGEATSQFGCMKTMLWWRSRPTEGKGEVYDQLMCDLRQTT